MHTHTHAHTHAHTHTRTHAHTHTRTHTTQTHSCPFPHAGKIDHSWVAFEWATDCGFQHLTEVLAEHLVDGRVLNSLSRDDLKKYLKISKKLDQLSFLSGVELLRMHEFNREVSVGDV